MEDYKKMLEWLSTHNKAGRLLEGTRVETITRRVVDFNEVTQFVLDQISELKEEESYCIQCEKNTMVLSSVDQDADEEYWFCPVCNHWEVQ